MLMPEGQFAFQMNSTRNPKLIYLSYARLLICNDFCMSWKSLLHPLLGFRYASVQLLVELPDGYPATEGPSVQIQPEEGRITRYISLIILYHYKNTIYVYTHIYIYMFYVCPYNGPSYNVYSCTLCDSRLESVASSGTRLCCGLKV